jgi:hypothetical protein
MNRIMLHSFLLSAALAMLAGLASCSGTQEDPSDSPKEYTTGTGKTIIVSESRPVGMSMSTIEISSRGFEHDIFETFENVAPIADVLLADLDGNGFDEIYIVTTSAGSGSYGGIIGFASNKDKSLSMIHFPDILEDDVRFAGYMGHDIFAVQDQKLVRTFPIYKKDDTNQNPTGGKRILVYGLYPGEAMWQLRIERFETRGSTKPSKSR